MWWKGKRVLVNWLQQASSGYSSSSSSSLLQGLWHGERQLLNPPWICFNASSSSNGQRLLLQCRPFHATLTSQQALVYQDEQGRPPKLLVVQPRIHPKLLLKARLHEALRLADSLEELREDSQASSPDPNRLPPFLIVQCPVTRPSRKRHKRVRADAYFGAGTIRNVHAHVLAAESQEGFDAVFVNATLTAVQQRNLERAWGKPVLDRVGLIIEIFGAHAGTKEAKLQVELAALNYKRSRLVRVSNKKGRRAFGVNLEAEVVSARGRGSGGRGFISGAGETEIQLQRRRLSERKQQLLVMLVGIRRTRTLHREARQRHGVTAYGDRVPVVAVVGYTNAGKSSLVAALSKSNLYIDDKLFATLDPRSRSVILPSGKKVFLSDTVGFISDLPVQLVEAFHATLEEVIEADFLLHVIDSSAPNANEQRSIVLKVLEEIGISRERLSTHTVEVWNKADLQQASNNMGLLDLVELEESINETHSLPAESNEPLTSDDTTADEDTDEETAEEATIEDLTEEETLASNSLVKDTAEVKGLSWSHEGIPCVATSVVKGTGLQDLLHLLDEKLTAKSNKLS